MGNHFVHHDNFTTDFFFIGNERIIPVYFNGITVSYLDGGYWVTLEILNIPWNESLLDFNTEYFDKAKLIIEKTVRTYVF